MLPLYAGQSKTGLPWSNAEQLKRRDPYSTPLSSRLQSPLQRRFVRRSRIYLWSKQTFPLQPHDESGDAQKTGREADDAVNDPHPHTTKIANVQSQHDTVQFGLVT